jgi:hypothetical protein
MGRTLPCATQPSAGASARVMHELMFKAARMVKHAPRWVLGLGANDAAFAVFQRHWQELDNPSTG